MALSLPFVGWLSLSQRMWLAEWSPPTAQRHKYMFGSKFPYLVDILHLREGHLCPSSISRHSESQSADSFLEEEGGTEEYTCPDYCQGTKGRATAAARTETVVLGRDHWDLPTNQVVPLSQAVEDTVTVSSGSRWLVSLCLDWEWTPSLLCYCSW